MPNCWSIIADHTTTVIAPPRLPGAATASNGRLLGLARTPRCSWQRNDHGVCETCLKIIG